MKRSVLILCTVVPVLAYAETAPEPSECGVVSVSMKPPMTQDLFEVSVAQVDGKNVNERPMFTLEPGKHVFKVREKIDDPRLAVGANSRGWSKEIEVEVEANQRYHLAAKFIPEKRFTNFKNYWEPVVWKSNEAPCK